MDHAEAQAYIDHNFEHTVLDELKRYIAIPCKSPDFDPSWEAHGHLQRAAEQIATWCKGRPIDGLSIDVHQEPGRTPLILIEIPGTDPEDRDTVLLYGHFDKQPEMSGWREELGPWKPVLVEDRLYGRGGADDGYSAYASLLAIEVLKRQELPHKRCVVLIEGSEESGSPDLPFYLEKLRDRIGSVSLVVCLDSGCGDYDHLWLTTSLRGMVLGTLSVEILREGVHSGYAGGIVPSTFRIARQLLSRLEDESTGTIHAAALTPTIPDDRRRQAAVAADVLQDQVFAQYPFVAGAGPTQTDRVELILNRTWRPALEVTGAGSIPSLSEAGNVARPKTELKLSIRLAPTTDPTKALATTQELLTASPPSGAHVHFSGVSLGGWNAPTMARWLEDSVNEASKQTFRRPAVAMGEGGSIPFMGMLGAQYPKAQFMITGVLGPNSNAHGPNEFLHLPCAKRLTAAVAHVVWRHHDAPGPI